MVADEGVALILIGSAFGQLLLSDMLKKESSNWIEALRILFLAGGGITFAVSLGYAASELLAPYQDIVEYVLAFIVVSFILLVFVAGVSWIVGIFQGMVKQVEDAKL